MLQFKWIENAPKTGHAIVVYYSATNNTERIAQIIANHIGAILYELEPVNPYTSADLNYNNSYERNLPCFIFLYKFI